MMALLNKALTAALGLLLLLIAPRGGSAAVAMVFSVHRHGARNLLPKNAFLSDDGAYGGPQLLPTGLRQCYTVGANYAQRYINATSCSATSPTTCLLRWFPGGSTGGDSYGIINQTGVGFDNYNAIFRSSELSRTVQSAASFLSGVFPAQQGASSDDTLALPTGQQVRMACMAHTMQCRAMRQTPMQRPLDLH